MSTIEILDAGPEHLKEIALLAEIVWRRHYPGILDQAQIEYMLRWMYNLDALTEEVKVRGIRFIRLMVDGKMVAFASWGPAGEIDTMKLHKLYVHPDQQRHGHGSRLLEHVEAQSRVAGARKLILAVNKGNAQAIAAYQRNGFAIERSVRCDIGGGFAMDDYIMAKLIEQE